MMEGSDHHLGVGKIKVGSRWIKKTEVVRQNYKKKYQLAKTEGRQISVKLCNRNLDFKEKIMATMTSRGYGKTVVKVFWRQ